MRIRSVAEFDESDPRWKMSLRLIAHGKLPYGAERWAERRVVYPAAVDAGFTRQEIARLTGDSYNSVCQITLRVMNLRHEERRERLQAVTNGDVLAGRAPDEWHDRIPTLYPALADRYALAESAMWSAETPQQLLEAEQRFRSFLDSPYHTLADAA